MQALISEGKLGLACGIEFFLRAVTGREMLFRTLHLRARCQRPDEDFFRIGDLRLDGSFEGRGRSACRCVLQLLPQDGRINAQLLCDLVSKLIANDTARDPTKSGEAIIYTLHL